MGFFDRFKKDKGIEGIAVIPQDGHVYAPADGKISTVFPTGHAVGITTADGAEILIHIGLDTVELKGEPFEQKVKEGQDVKKGDLLVVADLDKIKASGRETITPMIICNSDGRNLYRQGRGNNRCGYEAASCKINVQRG